MEELARTRNDFLLTRVREKRKEELKKREEKEEKGRSCGREEG